MGQVGPLKPYFKVGPGLPICRSGPYRGLSSDFDLVSRDPPEKLRDEIVTVESADMLGAPGLLMLTREGT